MQIHLKSDSVIIALAVDARENSEFRYVGLKFSEGTYSSQINSETNTIIEFSEFISGHPIVCFSSAKQFLDHVSTQTSSSSIIWDLSDLAEFVAPDLLDPHIIQTPQSDSLEIFDPIENPPLNSNLKEDAIKIWNFFQALMIKIDELPVPVIEKLASFSSQAQSPFSTLFVSHLNQQSSTKHVFSESANLKERLQKPKPIGSPTAAVNVSIEEINNYLGPDGPFAKRFPNYEARPEQLDMAKAIARTLGTPEKSRNHHIMVEGGTGIGKSVAYLLPAIIFAIKNNVRVLISTSTINLQEQLVKKDIPDVLETLKSSDLDINAFRFNQMKGKANYVCLKKWISQANSEYLGADQASVMCKTLLWLDHTKTGDRAELKIMPSEIGAWDRISASGFANCSGAKEGNCFYRHAREEALSSHIVVVNHALLLSDLLVEGSLLPDYEFLIIDEAHNLESEATRQFGFRVTRSRVEDLLDRLGQSIQSIISAIQELPIQETRIKTLNLQCGRIIRGASATRELWISLCLILAENGKSHSTNTEQRDELSITSAIRSSPDWSNLEIAWGDFENSFSELSTLVERLIELIDIPAIGKISNFESKSGELFDWTSEQIELRGKIASFISKPESDMIYWISDIAYGLSINGAPLEVSRQLQENLFLKKQSVTLTSATLTVDQDFSHFRRRLGLSSAPSLDIETLEMTTDELFLGSPFDYKNAALLCLPTDAPDPWQTNYTALLADSLVGLLGIANGHTMALFTSYKTLKSIASDLRKRLMSTGISVLEQGVDGTPDQLASKFINDPRSILLGTASFWEGVDLGNQALKILVMSRLPFSVPSDPIFSARSSQYNQPFVQFAVPQAILKFRQGFGRMIRSKEDKGVIIVLDGRINTKNYGKTFVSSLPGPTISREPLEEMLKSVSNWIKEY